MGKMIDLNPSEWRVVKAARPLMRRGPDLGPGDFRVVRNSSPPRRAPLHRDWAAIIAVAIVGLWVGVLVGIGLMSSRY